MKWMIIYTGSSQWKQNTSGCDIKLVETMKLNQDKVKMN